MLVDREETQVLNARHEARIELILNRGFSHVCLKDAFAPSA